MWRRRAFVAGLLAGLLLCAWLEFRFYPGHTYLQGNSQLFASMLERLEFPGLLGRDLVATHPNLRATVYDEASLSLLHLQPAATLSQVLAGQQFASRLALLLGLYLLLSAAGVSGWLGVFFAAVLGLGAWLPGLDLSTVGTEPTPACFAFGYAVLALGLASGERILLASLAGGIALLYSPVIAGPFWICAIAVAVLFRSYRPALRPLLTIGLVFALLSANLAQLQPGAPQESDSLDRLDPAWLSAITYRTPNAWPATWMAHTGWLFAAITVAAMVAAYRLWPWLRAWFKPFAAGLPVLGFGAALASAVIAPAMPFVFWADWQPSRFLVFSVTIAGALFAGCAVYAARRHRRLETLLWCSGVFAIALSSWHGRSDSNPNSVDQLSAWAEAHTWGGSLFLFADAGQQSHPGAFRTLSLRPVFVDWLGGALVTHSRAVAAEWTRRESIVGLSAWLAEPIDYVVFEHNHRLAGATPIFLNRDFAVYDAQTLRGLPALEERR